MEGNIDFEVDKHYKLSLGSLNIVELANKASFHMMAANTVEIKDTFIAKEASSLFVVFKVPFDNGDVKGYFEIQSFQMDKAIDF